MILKNMLNMQMMMFLLVLIGFLIRKQNIVETEGRKNMVDLCLDNILNSFFVDWKWEMLISCSVILLLSVGYNAVSVFLSSVLFKKAPQDRKKITDYFGVSKMIYISCKPTSLARDLVLLQEKGYRVKRVCCVDQFCHTVHIETIVELELAK